MDLQDIKRGLEDLSIGIRKDKALRVIQKAFNVGEISGDLLVKAKYIRRTGTKGNYKYIYDEGSGRNGGKKVAVKKKKVSKKESVKNMNTQELAKYLGLETTYRTTQSSTYHEIKDTQIRVSDHEPNLIRLNTDEKENIILMFTENSGISESKMSKLEDKLFEIGFENVYVDKFDSEQPEVTKKLFNRNIV